jgi:hypothetical protein
VICGSTSTTIWISSAPGGGQYHAQEICQSLGYRNVIDTGNNCNSVCGYCQGTTSCSAPGNEFFDQVPGVCAVDQYGVVLCFSVTWLCSN